MVSCLNIYYLKRRIKTWKNIFEYTAERFGLDQAIKYLEDFDFLFALLCDNKELGREGNEIKQGVRSINKESHIVFYRIDRGRLVIIRVLHASMDMPNFLK
ncbi:MAG: type II toxin-antitoxin system RelE/ParE family toxin [Bacteroidetes bacterium]|nr:type II toxin-antitoxin system RelE/ParE family toxin [Bacteroidota bacterium]